MDYWSQMTPKNQPSKRQYYLLVGRLEPYKKVDLVLKAFANMPESKLVVIGTGTLESRLIVQSSPNVMFISNIPDDTLAEYYYHAKALIMPQEEDFGYVSLEAQACGCPVIAFNQGGAKETVIDLQTGVFFSSQSTEALKKAIAEFDIISGDIYKKILKVKSVHLALLSREKFEKKFMSFIQFKI